MRLFALIIVAALSWAVRLDAWQEDGAYFSPRNEFTAGPTNNDNLPSSPYFDSSSSGNLNSAPSGPLTSGTGYIFDNNDQDAYQFFIGSAHVVNLSCTNLLRVRFTAPANRRYRVELYGQNGIVWNGYSINSATSEDGKTEEFYLDVSNAEFQNMSFAAQVRDDGTGGDTLNPYTLELAVVQSAFLNGQVTLVGVGTSGSGQVNVSAQSQSGQRYPDAQTNSSGAYSIRVPLGAMVSQIEAYRNWNSGPPDEAYGTTRYTLPSPLMVALACNPYGNYDFNVYREASISGSVSGLIPAAGLSLRLDDPYSWDNNSGGGGWVNLSFSPGAISYSAHNLAPGTYRLRATSQMNDKAPIFVDNLVLTDGQNKTVNLSFNNGNVLTGNLSPASGSPMTVKIYRAGTAFSEDMGQADNITGAFSLVSLPAGTYDIALEGSGGTSSYLPLIGVVVPGGPVTISSLNLSGNITGQISDSLGFAANQLFIFAVRQGEDPALTPNSPAAFTQPVGGTPPYSYTLPVDPAYNWDLLLGTDGGPDSWPTFMDGVSNVASTATGQDMATSLGVTISGAASIAGVPIGQIGVNFNRIPVGVFASGGNFRNGSEVEQSGGYIMPGVPPMGAATLKSKPRFLQLASYALSVGGSPITQNINFSVDAAQDDYLPAAGQLEPAHGSSVDIAIPTIRARLFDNSLGMGVSAQPVISIDGGSNPPVGISWAGGLLSFFPTNPLSNGSHTVILTFNDTASPSNPGSVTWTFDVDLVTPSPTFTPYAGTPTNSPTWTMVIVPTLTPTPLPGFWSISENGPFGGKMGAIAMSPNFTGDGTVFVGNTQGEVYKSVNSGADWGLVLYQEGFFGQDANITEIVVSPNFTADGTVFVVGSSGSGCDYLFRSMDRGATWTSSPAPSGYSGYPSLVIAPDYGSSGTLFLGLENGPGGSGAVFKTTNSGASWSMVTSTAQRVSHLGISPNYAIDGTVIAAVDTSQNLKTTDGGANWSTISLFDVHTFAFSPNYASDNTLFAAQGCCSPNLVQRSTDGGTIWTSIDSNLPSNFFSSSVGSLYARTATDVFAVSGEGGNGNNGIMRWNGSMWSDYSTGLTNKDITALAISPNFGSDSTMLAASHGNGVYKSTSAGGSFSPSSNKLRALSQLGKLLLAPDYSSSQTLFYTDDSAGIFKSSNDGATWSNIFYGDSVAHLGISPNYGVDDTLFAYQNSNASPSAIYKSTNGGSSWSSVYALNGQRLTSLGLSPGFAGDGTVFALNSMSAGYCDDASVQVLKSINFGSGWSVMLSITASCDQRNASLYVSPNYALDSTAFAEVVLTTNATVLLRTINGGSSWTSISTTANLPAFGMAFSNNYASDQTLYRSFFGAGVEPYKSVNAGGNWSVDTNVPLGGVITAVAPDGTRFGTTFTYSGNCAPSAFIPQFSTDGGACWTPLPNTGTGAYYGARLAIRPGNISNNFAGDRTVWSASEGSGGVFKSSSVPLISCGTPTPSWTASPSFTASPIVTATPTFSPSPSHSPSPTPSPTSIYAWNETSSFGSLNEPSNNSVTNHVTPGPSVPYPAGGVSNINSVVGNIYQTGAGYMASGSDQDVFQFRVNAGDFSVGSCMDLLRLTLTSPSNESSYSLDLYAWNGSSWGNVGGNGGGNNGVSTSYYDLAPQGSTQEFYVVVRTYGNSSQSDPYTLNLAIVGSATLRGKVTPLGGDTIVSFNVRAILADLSSLALGAGTDGNGDYNFKVPAGVGIAVLEATRNWYNGAPPGYAYGPTQTRLASPVNLPVCGEQAGLDFNVYPEAVISGTYSGTASSNWMLNLNNPYENWGNGNGNLSITVGSYSIHNVLPGTYRLAIDAQDGTTALNISENVVATDGKVTVQNLSFNGGGSISGSVTPAGSGDLKVKIYYPGTDNEVRSQNNVSGTFNINRIPAGLWDVRVESNGGPAAYIPNRNVSVSVAGNTPSPVGSLNLNSTISGQVYDTLSLGSGAIFVLGVREGDNPYFIDGRGFTAVFAPVVGASSPYSYTLPVDSAYNYEITLLSGGGNNGFPDFIDGLNNVSPTTGNADLTTYSGYTVSGTILLNGLNPLSQGWDANTSIIAFASGGNFRAGFGSEGSAFVSSPLPNGTYSFGAQPKYFLTGSTGPQVISGSNVSGALLNLVPDPAQDVYVPFASELIPIHGQIISVAFPVISCKVSDLVLGTGINPAAGLVSATVDTLAVDSFNYNPGTGRVSFTAMSPGLATGMSHTVEVYFSDQASSPHSSFVSWQFWVDAAFTPTATPTFSVSPTPSPTATPSFSHSPTASPSFTASPFLSETPSFTASPTHTPSPTPTPTSTYAWQESIGFGGQSEAPASQGNNDPTPSYTQTAIVPGVAYLNSAASPNIYGTGAGFISSSSDIDVYQFRVNVGDTSACNKVLRVRVTPPGGYRLRANLYAMDTGYWTYSGDNSDEDDPIDLYYDLSSMVSTQDFYLALRSDNGSSSSTQPYLVNLQVVSSATISGNLSLVGATSQSGVQVRAVLENGQQIGKASTNGSGAYTLTVPSSVPIASLSAVRWWYMSSEPYGVRTYRAPSGILNLAPCATLSGVNFEVYREGRLSGAMSGITTTSGLNIELIDPYRSGNWGGSMWQAQGVTGYAMRNLEPGTYDLKAGFWGPYKSEVFYRQVIITDGLTTTRDLNFTDGGTIFGSITPAGTDLRVKVSIAGTSRSGSYDVGEDSGVSNSYSVAGIPPGTYTVSMEDQAGSPYLPVMNVVVTEGGSTQANLSGPVPDLWISGTITDTLSLGPGFFLFASKTGEDIQAMMNNAAPSYFAEASGTASPYSYSINVPSSYSGSWDIILVREAGDGMPAMYGSLAAVPVSSTTANFSTGTGYDISGAFTVGGQTLGQLGISLRNSGFTAVYAATGANIRGFAALTSGGYAMSSMTNGSYTLKARPQFMLEASAPATVSGGPVTADLATNVDTAQDIHPPFGYRLQPVAGSTVGVCNPPLSLRLADGALGMGAVAPAAGAVYVDGVAAASVIYNGGTGQLDITPASALGDGPHTVEVNFTDSSSSVNLCTITWSFTQACATPTITQSNTPTRSATPTITPSFTPSPSPSLTATPTEFIPAVGDIVINEVNVGSGSVELRNLSAQLINLSFWLYADGGPNLINVSVSAGAVWGPWPYGGGSAKDLALFLDNSGSPGQMLDYVAWGNGPQGGAGEGAAVGAGLWIASRYVDTNGYAFNDSVSYNGGSAQHEGDFCVMAGNTFGALNNACPPATYTYSPSPSQSPSPSASPTPGTPTALPTQTFTPTVGPGYLHPGVATNGRVFDIVTNGSTVYLGGNFTLVGARSGPGVPLSMSTGAPLAGFPMFAPAMHVEAVIGDGQGGWYVAGAYQGAFSHAAGVTRVSLAHILPNMSLDPVFNVGTTGVTGGGPWVNALALDGNVLYIGGYFGDVNGAARQNLAAIDATTGAPLAWNPALDGSVDRLLVSGGKLYVGGAYANIAGQARANLASFDLPAGTVTAWDPSPNNYITALEEGPGGNILVGGAFGSIGGQPRSSLAELDPSSGLATAWAPDPDNVVDTIDYDGGSGLTYIGGVFTSAGGQTRYRIAAINASGSATAWAPDANGPVTALAVDGSTVYVGGHFNSNAGTVVSIGGATRDFLAAIDTGTGIATGWDPHPNKLVRDLAVQPGVVYIGGEMSGINSSVRQGVAAVNAATGALDPFVADLGAFGEAYTLALDGSMLYIGGSFGSINGAPRVNLGAIDVSTGVPAAWDPSPNNTVVSLLAAAGQVFAGGNFTAIGGQSLNFAAQLVDATSGTGWASAWDAGVNGVVRALDACPGGICLGGDFTTAGGQARNYAAIVDFAGSATSWNPNPDGGLADMLFDSAGTIYLAGGFFNAGGQPRLRLAAVDTAGGLATAFQADNGPIGPEKLALNAGILYAGGGFVAIGSYNRNKLAALDPSSGAVLPNWGPDLGGSFGSPVDAMAVAGTKLFVGGTALFADGHPLGGFGAFEIPSVPYQTPTITETPSASPSETASPTESVTETDTPSPSDTPSPTPSASPTALPDRLLVNVNNGTYGPDADGFNYDGDFDPSIYSGSYSPYTETCCDILGTIDDPLYNTGIFGNDFTVTVPLRPGSYQVTLKFTDPYSNGGNRIFDIFVNGIEVVSNVDPGGQAGQSTALDIQIDGVIPVSGSITLRFLGMQSLDPNAILDAFRIIPMSEVPTDTPTATASPTWSASPTPSVSRTFTRTRTVTFTGTPSATPSNTPIASATETRTVTPSITPSNTPSITPSATPSNTQSSTPSNTPVDTATSTATSAATATSTATATPVVPDIIDGGPMAWSPLSITVPQGYTVRWTWTGFHSVVSTTGAEPYTSGAGSSGGTFTHQFNTAGTFTYECGVHGSMMSGTIIVQAPTATVTPSWSASPSSTVSPSMTPSWSASPTRSITPSVTPSNTPSSSVTPSNTPTSSVTPSNTSSSTATLTITETRTATQSITPSSTVTPSNTPTSTVTPSITHTSTVTPSNTPSSTVTPSITETRTVTPSATETRTPTPSITLSHTASPPFSATNTPTITESWTASPTFSASPTWSVSPTSTETPTVTPSATPTYTATPSNTPSSTVTPSVTPTNSPTSSVTPSVTPTHTESVTPTNSPTRTATQTVTPSATETTTSTNTPTFSPSPTISETSTTTLTPTISPTFSVTPTASLTPAFSLSPKDKPLVGPVPAKSSDDLCASFPSAPDTSLWEIYNAAGELVAKADLSGSKHCLKSPGLAAGVYDLRIRVKLMNGGSRENIQRIIIEK